MDLLHWLESIRTPVFDFIMTWVSYPFNADVAFLAVGFLVLWCLDKRLGYFILGTGYVATGLNGTLKNAFRVPRPWVLDPTLTIVGKAPSGYSFPSMHTTTTVATAGGWMISRGFGKKLWEKTAFILAALLLVAVPVSRLYLGVHTLLDVGVAFVIGLCILFAGWAVFRKRDFTEKRFWPVTIVIGLLIAALGFCQMNIAAWTGGSEKDIASAGVWAWDLLGNGLGFMTALVLDRLFVRFDTRAPFWGQVLKFVLGFALFLLIRSGLGIVMVKIFGDQSWILPVRLFIAQIFAGFIWPLTFPLFSKVGKK